MWYISFRIAPVCIVKVGMLESPDRKQLLFIHTPPDIIVLFPVRDVAPVDKVIVPDTVKEPKDIFAFHPEAGFPSPILPEESAPKYVDAGTVIPLVTLSIDSAS